MSTSIEREVLLNYSSKLIVKLFLFGSLVVVYLVIEPIFLNGNKRTNRNAPDTARSNFLAIPPFFHLNTVGSFPMLWTSFDGLMGILVSCLKWPKTK